MSTSAVRLTRLPLYACHWHDQHFAVDISTRHGILLTLTYHFDGVLQVWVAFVMQSLLERQVVLDTHCLVGNASAYCLQNMAGIVHIYNISACMSISCLHDWHACELCTCAVKWRLLGPVLWWMNAPFELICRLVPRPSFVPKDEPKKTATSGTLADCCADLCCMLLACTVHNPMLVANSDKSQKIPYGEWSVKQTNMYIYIWLTDYWPYARFQGFPVLCQDLSKQRVWVCD